MPDGTVKYVIKYEYEKLQKTEKQLLSLQRGVRDPWLRRGRILYCKTRDYIRICKITKIRKKQLLSLQKDGGDPVLRRRRILQCNKCQMGQWNMCFNKNMKNTKTENIYYHNKEVCETRGLDGGVFSSVRNVRWYCETRV